MLIAAILFASVSSEVCIAQTGPSSAASSSTQKLISAQKPVPYTLQRSSNGATLIITKQNSNVRVTTFTLPNPARIVVDVRQSEPSWSSVKKFNDSVVNSLRIGSHRDKLRFVVDLSDKNFNYKNLKLVNSASGNSQIIDFSLGGSSVLRSVKKTMNSNSPLSNGTLKEETLVNKLPVQKSYGSDEVNKNTIKTAVVTPGVKPVSTPVVLKPTNTPTSTPIPTATSTSTPIPTKVPTNVPTKVKPTIAPTSTPTVVPTFTRTATPTPTRRATSTPIPVVTYTFTPVPTSVPTLTPTSKVIRTLPPTIAPTVDVKTSDAGSVAGVAAGATAVEANSKDASGANTKLKQGVKVLNKISFDYVDPSKKVGGIRLSFSGSVDYKLTRRTPDLYTLTVKGADVGDKSVTLPIFPPQDFNSFVSVRAIKKSGGLEVKIYVEDGVYLISFTKGNDIWFRAFPS